MPLGGVLCALPALLGFGLLRHTRENFTLQPGFYPIETIFLVVAFLALARIRSLEALRYQAPGGGEWGKLLGLDRVPEVKTLREKLGILCAEPERARAWSSTLARDRMEATPESAGTLYIDGHVRVYHGGVIYRRFLNEQNRYRTIVPVVTVVCLTAGLLQTGFLLLFHDIFPLEKEVFFITSVEFSLFYERTALLVCWSCSMSA